MSAADLDPTTTVGAIRARQTPAVTEARPARRYKRPRPGQTPVTFQLLQCKHHAPSDGLLLTGRSAEGRHVTVLVPDPTYTFYLQHAQPFVDDADAAACLAQLEDLLAGFAETGYHVPSKGGDPAQDREACSVSRSFWPRRSRDGTEDRSRLRIKSWARADGVFRTMYGWTPPQERLQNLLEVRVGDPRLVRLYTQFIDSDEYLQAVGALPGGAHPGARFRAFQGATIEPELRLRMQQKITLGGWCALTRYYAKPAGLAPLYTDTYYVADGGIQALRPLPERTGTAPLKMVSFDIEAAGRNGRFPAARWNVARLYEYLNKECDVPPSQLRHARSKILARGRELLRASPEYEIAADARAALLDELTRLSFADLAARVVALAEDARQRSGTKGSKKIKTLAQAGVPTRTFRTVKEMRDTLSREYPHTLRAQIPSNTDTDPAFLIVAVEWIYGENHDLQFASQRAFLYRHPEQVAPYDRPPRHRLVPAAEAATLDPQSLPDQYRTLAVSEYRCEAEMIYAFVDDLHARRPDIVNTWNGLTFDIPFLYERIEFLKKHGTRADKAAIEAHGGGVNFGLVRGGQSYAREVTKTTNAGGDRAYLKVATDFLSHLDGQVVWENTSFGEREARGNKLDIVSESRLTYPGTKVPRRKLEVDVTKGGEYWREGGRRLWIFIAYCAVDARLPVQLLLKRGKISMAVGLARLANVSLHAVYNNGLQMKVVSMLAQEYYEHRGNCELLVEYGRRHSHWPDVWLRLLEQCGAAPPRLADYEEQDGTTPHAPQDEGGATKRASEDDGATLGNEPSTDDGDEEEDGGRGGLKRPPPERGEDDPHALAHKRLRRGGGGLKRPLPERDEDDLHAPARKRLRRTIVRKERKRTENVHVVDWVHTHPRFQPVPAGMKGYEGAHVFEPTRGFHHDLIATADFASLYPFIVISHYLSYMTFLTSYAIAYYGVPAHHYTTVPLGEASRIFCGESLYDPAEAAANEYPTSELKVAYFYANADNAFRNMLLRVYALRKKYKRDMAQWKVRKLVLQKGRDDRARQAWLEDPDALPGAEAYIENGAAFARLKTAVRAGADAYAALYDEALAAVGGSEVADPVAEADNQVSVANATQLACKFFINGAYGFTTSSAKIAMVPLMEIGAAVTSYGRVCIRSSAYAADHLTVPELVAAMARAARTEIEALVDEFNAGRDPEYPVRLVPLDDLAALAAEREVVRKQHAKHADKAVYTHGGDTDSVMLGYPRKYATREGPKVIKMATFVAAWIDQYMRDLMVLEQEKTSMQTLFFELKNYLMDQYGDAGILYKGFEPVRRDTLPFVRLTVVAMIMCILGKRLPPDSDRPAVPETHAERVLEAVAYARRRLLALARGEIPLAELTQSQQIRKLAYDAPPVAMGAVEKMQARGQRVQIGDRVLFVFRREGAIDEAKVLRRKARSYIKPDKARDLADDVTHVIANNVPLDYEYYYQNKVKNPLRKVLRHLLAPVRDYPTVVIGSSEAERKAVKERAAKVKKWQDRQVDRELFAEVDAFFARRRRIAYKDTLHRSQRQTALVIEYECPICADFFSVASFGRPQQAGQDGGICPGCQQKRGALVTETRRLADANAAATEEKLETCRDCIRRTGFEGDIAPEDCHKYFCSVFEARDALSITKKQLQQRLRNLGVTDPAQLEW